MSQVSLFFMYRSFGGGTTSFTAYLYMALRFAGHQPFIYRVTERGDGRLRNFSGYTDILYQNITTEQAIDLVKSTPSLLTAPCNPKYLAFNPVIIPQLLEHGMRCVIHDPNELMIYEHTPWVTKPIIIRPTMLQFFKDAVFIPHPYVTWFKEMPSLENRSLNAISIARVTFVKRTEIILEANRLVDDNKKVVLRGAENRLYTRHKLSKLFPEYEQGLTGYPLTWGAGPEECVKAKFAVDMTFFPNDGGGSQYSFMEAWDAGTINVVHRDWLRYDGEMKDNVNCLAINDVEDLSLLLQGGVAADGIRRIAEMGRLALDTTHDPINVAEQYAKELGL